MPTYKITDPQTGKTLQVTSNRQPTLQVEFTLTTRKKPAYSTATVGSE